MKKMIILFLIMIFTCMGGSAESNPKDLPLTERRPMYTQFLDLRYTYGGLAQLPLEEKYQVLQRMQTLGFAMEELPEPSEDHAEEVYRMLFEKYIGPYDAASPLDIILLLEGDMTFWPLEMKAWYSSYLFSHNRNQDSWQTILPGEEDLTEDEAVQLAVQAVCDATQLPRETFDGYVFSVDFFMHDTCPEPRWHIQLHENAFVPPAYAVLLTRDGSVTEDIALGIPLPALQGSQQSEIESSGVNASAGLAPEDACALAKKELAYIYDVDPSLLEGLSCTWEKETVTSKENQEVSLYRVQFGTEENPGMVGIYLQTETGLEYGYFVSAPFIEMKQQQIMKEPQMVYLDTVASICSSYTGNGYTAEQLETWLMALQTFDPALDVSSVTTCASDKTGYTEAINGLLSRLYINDNTTNYIGYGLDTVEATLWGPQSSWNTGKWLRWWLLEEKYQDAPKQDVMIPSAFYDQKAEQKAIEAAWNAVCTLHGWQGTPEENRMIVGSCYGVHATDPEGTNPYYFIQFSKQNEPSTPEFGPTSCQAYVYISIDGDIIEIY